MTEELHLEGDSKVPPVESAKKLIGDLRRRKELPRSEKKPVPLPEEDNAQAEIKDTVELSDEAKRLAALSDIKLAPPIDKEALDDVPGEGPTGDELDTTI